MVGGGENVTTGREIDKGDGVRKVELLDGGVCSECQSLAHSMRKKRWEVHPRVAALDRRVLDDKEREVRVAVFVREGELIVCSRWVCEWERTEGRRQRGRVSYSSLRWTLCVSTPAQLSRSLLWPNTLSIRSGICMPMGNLGGTRSSQSCILLHLLLNQEVELGSSSHGSHFLCMASKEKHGMCGGSSMSWRDGAST